MTRAPSNTRTDVISVIPSQQVGQQEEYELLEALPLRLRERLANSTLDIACKAVAAQFLAYRRDHGLILEAAIAATIRDIEDTEQAAAAELEAERGNPR